MQTTGESIDAVVQRLVDQGVFCAVPLTLDRKPQACIPAKQLDYVMTWACYEARVPYGPQQQQRVIHALATKLSPNIKIASKFRDPASRIEVKNSIVNVKICSEMMAPQQQQHPQQQKHPQPPPRAVPPQQQPPPRWTTSTSLQAALAATGRLSPSATRPSSFSSSAGSLNRMPPHVGWDQRAAAAAQHARTSSIYGSSSLGSLVGQERPASCRTAAGPAVPTAVGSGERICYARTQMETDNVHGGRTDPYSLVQLSLQSGFPMVPLVDEAGKGLLATVRVSFLPVQGHEKAPMVTVRGTDDPAFTAAAAVGVAMAKELVPRVQAALGLAPVPRAMLAAPVVVEVGYPGASYKGGSVGLAATLAYFKAVFQEELNLGGVVATGILDFDGDVGPMCDGCFVV